MRIRTIVVAGSALALLTALAACTTPAASDGSSTVPATTTSSGAASTAAPGGHGGEGASGGGTVVAASFRADLTVQKAGLGLLTLTNVSKNNVTVKGWASLVFLNAANEAVAVPVKQVNVPGAGSSITVPPGRTAFAGVKWAVGAKADPKTFVATSVQLTPPGASGRINVKIVGTDGRSGGYVEFDMTSVQVGTLQPSSQGVLVF